MNYPQPGMQGTRGLGVHFLETQRDGLRPRQGQLHPVGQKPQGGGAQHRVPQRRARPSLSCLATRLCQRLPTKGSGRQAAGGGCPSSWAVPATATLASTGPIAASPAAPRPQETSPAALCCTQARNQSQGREQVERGRQGGFQARRGFCRNWLELAWRPLPAEDPWEVSEDALHQTTRPMPVSSTVTPREAELVLTVPMATGVTGHQRRRGSAADVTRSGRRRAEGWPGCPRQGEMQGGLGAAAQLLQAEEPRTPPGRNPTAGTSPSRGFQTQVQVKDSQLLDQRGCQTPLERDLQWLFGGPPVLPRRVGGLGKGIPDFGRPFGMVSKLTLTRGFRDIAQALGSGNTGPG